MPSITVKLYQPLKYYPDNSPIFRTFLSVGEHRCQYFTDSLDPGYVIVYATRAYGEVSTADIFLKCVECGNSDCFTRQYKNVLLGEFETQQDPAGGPESKVWTWSTSVTVHSEVETTDCYVCEQRRTSDQTIRSLGTRLTRG